MVSKDRGGPGLKIATVCARGGSKGVVRKNLRCLAGAPLIAHTLAQARACSSFDGVYGSTDDPEIQGLLTASGVETFGLRPAHLASDAASKWDVFRHLVELVEQGTGHRVELLADLDTGAILRSPADIDCCVQRLEEGDAEVCVTAYEADHNPYYNVVEPDASGNVRVCIRQDPPIVNRQQAPPAYNLSPAVFAIRRQALFRESHWSRCRMQISVLPRQRALDIDTELDFRLVESLYVARFAAERAGSVG